jgi:hypothetical protein
MAKFTAPKFTAPNFTAPKFTAPKFTALITILQHCPLSQIVEFANSA